MRIIKLLNTIAPEIYFNNIFECLFGSRDYRIRHSFLYKIQKMKKELSIINSELIINQKSLIKNDSFEIKYKKPFFFRQTFNSFQNMKTFRNIMTNLYRTIDNFIKFSQYQEYRIKIIINTNIILIEK